MKAPSRSRQNDTAEQHDSAPVPVVYDLRRMVGGDDEGARCLSASQSAEFAAVVKEMQPRADFEYPNARQLLQGARKTGAPLDKSPVARQLSRPQTQSLPRRIAIGAACGLISLGILLIASAIAESHELGVLFGLLLSVVGASLLFAVVVALRRSTASHRQDKGRRRASSRVEQPGATPPSWGLRPRAGLVQALRVGFRTAGLGLLVRPVDVDASKASARPRRSRPFQVNK